MITIYVAGVALQVEPKVKPGDIITRELAQLLLAEQVKRVSTQIRWRVNRRKLPPAELSAEIQSIIDNFQFTELDEAISADEPEDPVDVEAMKIAKELIIAEMASSGITEIPNIDNHARAVVDANPAIRERALQRVQLRYSIAQKAIGAAV